MGIRGKRNIIISKMLDINRNNNTITIISPEIVKNNKTGFIVEDFKEMAKAIRGVDEINRTDCRARVEKYFSVEKMVDGYETVYEKAIEKFKKSKI